MKRLLSLASVALVHLSLLLPAPAKASSTDVYDGMSGFGGEPSYGLESGQSPFASSDPYDPASPSIGLIPEAQGRQESSFDPQGSLSEAFPTDPGPQRYSGANGAPMFLASNGDDAVSNDIYDPDRSWWEWATRVPDEEPIVPKPPSASEPNTGNPNVDNIAKNTWVRIAGWFGWGAAEASKD